MSSTAGSGLAARVGGDLLHRSRRRRRQLFDVGLEPRSVGLAVDHQIEGVVLETIDGALGQKRVVKGADPLGRVAVAGDDGGEAGVSLDEELVDVAALVAAHGLKREVVDDEHVDGGELGHDGLARIVHAALFEQPQEGVGAQQSYVEARAAAEVAERVRQERLADAHGAEDHDVAVILDEAQRDELIHDPAVVRHLRGLVPALEHHVGIQTGDVGATDRRRAVPTRDLVDEKHEQEVLVRRVLLLGESKALDQRRQQASEAQALERGHQVRADRSGAHRSPPSWTSAGLPSVAARVAKAAGSRAKRAGSGISRPVATAASSVRRASLSMPSMRRTSMTSKASARAQSALTRSWP